MRENILIGSDFQHWRLETNEDFSPGVGKRGAPRGSVARRLFHRLAHAQREIVCDDGRREPARGAMGALEPRPPQLRVALMVPGAEPVAAFPYRQHLWRIAGVFLSSSPRKHGASSTSPST